MGTKMEDKQLLHRIAHEMASMVVRQTDMSHEDAVQRLKEHQGDYMKVIREAHGIETKEHAVVKSRSQETYRQIRGCMDAAARSYELAKENREMAQSRSNGNS